ncbi:hypothetical protein B0A55_12771 [Friedmanniomyces simplex]|uniref:Aquaporin-1 n=1 Tax=Friedmanniomyces simplex TaxID=329884 RepID=A0A4U0WGS3_9PEZI|nr:hypothetical protein B0A55_12771 [Friedmanniomyces simplex]
MGQPSTKSHSASNPFFGFLGPTKDAKTASSLQAHLVAMTGELFGTFMFLFLAYCGHTMILEQSPRNRTRPQRHEFCLDLRGLLLLPVQIMASMAAAGVVSAIIPGSIKTVQTSLTPTMSVAQGVFLEMFLTAFFIINILMLAAEKSKDTFLAPIGIGLTLFICEIAGVYYTGASLNPARSFGPCVAGRNFQHYHWIYWIGPLLGALIAAGYYHFVKFFNYEEANRGQDSSGGDFGGNQRGFREDEG